MLIHWVDYFGKFDPKFNKVKVTDKE